MPLCPYTTVPQCSSAHTPLSRNASLAPPHNMAAYMRRWRAAGFGWLPTLQNVRHGSKAVTRHRKAMHFERQKIMAVTQYIAPKPAVPERCVVPRAHTKEEGTGLEKLKHRQLEGVFRENKMIAVFQNNALPAGELLILRHRLLKHRIHLKFFSNQVVMLNLSGTRYQNLLPLFIGHNLLMVSPEVKVKEMMQVLRSTPHIQLLGACIENTILSKQGVINCSKVPSMAVVQEEVVSNLTQMLSETGSLLLRSYLHLTALLQQYLKEQSDKAAERPAQAC
ncbi:39S ribosomal protein L10, mitochondrial [Rhinatrema bivittatum]|uniref:39S ribosomal protein L10, mitochondrial n=1 Tax=Rhinatrema bivittatum TaxID=194408 RepID=UPI0011293752|nr:39S ribosomal protein L10, mitochondrial [Rhinatrema bivittatum]